MQFAPQASHIHNLAKVLNQYPCKMEKKKLELTTKTQAHMEQPKYKTNKAQPQVK